MSLRWNCTISPPSTRLRWRNRTPPGFVVRSFGIWVSPWQGRSDRRQGSDDEKDTASLGRRYSRGSNLQGPSILAILTASPRLKMDPEVPGGLLRRLRLLLDNQLACFATRDAHGSARARNTCILDGYFVDPTQPDPRNWMLENSWTGGLIRESGRVAVHRWLISRVQQNRRFHHRQVCLCSGWTIKKETSFMVVLSTICRPDLWCSKQSLTNHIFSQTAMNSPIPVDHLLYHPIIPAIWPDPTHPYSPQLIRPSESGRKHKWLLSLQVRHWRQCGLAKHFGVETLENERRA